MSTYYEERLYQGQPGTTDATIFTAGTSFTDPAGNVINNVKRIIVKTVNIANTTGNQATANVSLVPSGGTAANSRLIPGVTIQANSQALVDPSQVMYPGETLVASQGTASALTLTISGWVVTS